MPLRLWKEVLEIILLIQTSTHRDFSLPVYVGYKPICVVYSSLCFDRAAGVINKYQLSKGGFFLRDVIPSKLNRDN